MEGLERSNTAGTGGAGGAGRTRAGGRGRALGPSRLARGVSAQRPWQRQEPAGALSPCRVPRAEQGPFKALYNSELRFRQRLYADLETILYRVRLFRPLAQLVKQAALYVRKAVPPQVFQALSRCGRPRGRASPASRLRSRPALKEGNTGAPLCPCWRGVLPAALTRGSVPSALPLAGRSPEPHTLSASLLTFSAQWGGGGCEVGSKAT